MANNDKIRCPEEIAATEEKLNAAEEKTVTVGEKITATENIIKVLRPSLSKKNDEHVHSLKGSIPKKKAVRAKPQDRTRNVRPDNRGPINQFSSRDALSAAKEIAKELKNIFPIFSPEFLLDKAKKCGTIKNAVDELLYHVVDQDFFEEKSLKERVDKSLLLLDEGDMFKKVTLTEKRDFNPNDPLQTKFRLAKGHYLSMSEQFASPIESIDYIENRILMEVFERRKYEFKLEGKDTNEYFLFHGTNNWNVQSILKENFRIDLAGKHGQAQGRGIYFSEKTAVPEQYMKGTQGTLLLCRVLLGREFIDEHSKACKAKDIPEGFDSKSVKPDKDKRAKINIIKEVDQILPYFVLNFAPPDEEDEEDESSYSATNHAHANAKVTAWLAKFT